MHLNFNQAYSNVLYSKYIVVLPNTSRNCLFSLPSIIKRPFEDCNHSQIYRPVLYHISNISRNSSNLTTNKMTVIIYFILMEQENIQICIHIVLDNFWILNIHNSVDVLTSVLFKSHLFRRWVMKRCEARDYHFIYEATCFIELCALNGDTWCDPNE